MYTYLHTYVDIVVCQEDAYLLYIQINMIFLEHNSYFILIF